MSTQRQFAAAGVLDNGKVIIAGGRTWISSWQTAEVYDPATDAWLQVAPMMARRDGAIGVALPNNRFLVVGGNQFGGPDAEIYDFDSNTWSATSPMVGQYTLRGFTVTPLSDGRIFVVNNQNGNRNCEVYDSSADLWYAVRPMISSHPGHSAVLLADGRVLVADFAGNPSEIYDPTTDGWSQAARMIDTPSGMSTILLQDGRVLAAGAPCCPSTDYDGEVYDPARDTWTRTPYTLVGQNSPGVVLLYDGTALVTGGYGDYVCYLEDCDPVETAGSQLFVP
jgi:hypothetical protein